MNNYTAFFAIPGRENETDDNSVYDVTWDFEAEDFARAQQRTREWAEERSLRIVRLVEWSN
jgi:hypothetical protein